MATNSTDQLKRHGEGKQETGKPQQAQKSQAGSANRCEVNMSLCYPGETRRMFPTIAFLKRRRTQTSLAVPCVSREHLAEFQVSQE